MPASVEEPGPSAEATHPMRDSPDEQEKVRADTPVVEAEATPVAPATPAHHETPPQPATAAAPKAPQQAVWGFLVLPDLKRLTFFGLGYSAPKKRSAKILPIYKSFKICPYSPHIAIIPWGSK